MQKLTPREYNDRIARLYIAALLEIEKTGVMAFGDSASAARFMHDTAVAALERGRGLGRERINEDRG